MACRTAVLLAVLGLAAASASASSASSSADEAWDLLVLAADWPGGYQREKWPACVGNFTVHGLWPSTNTGGSPTCSGSPFSMSAIQSLLPTLDCLWPSVQGESRDEDFWQHEWEKHGVCAVQDSKLADERGYFQGALDLLSANDLLRILTNAGITPSYDTHYAVKSIRSAITDVLGVNPALKCQESRLLGVDLCYTKALKLQDCPQGIIERDDDCKSEYTWFNPIKNA